MEQKALGKGLSALIPMRSDSDKKEMVAYVKTDLIADNSLQPRTNYDTAKIEELKKSIQEKGILQPILVRTKGDSYEVVAGERRLKAARALMLEQVPVIVKQVDDQEALVIALIENIQREELNPIEEAEGFKRLIEDFHYTQESISQSVGKDRSTVANMLRLLKLPDDIKKNIYNGDLSMGHARALLAVENSVEQGHFFALTVKKGLSVRELENLIRAEKRSEGKPGKAVKPKNFQITSIEEGLQKLLGTKVRIEANKKRGKIILEYYSQEDLERIVKAIIK